MDNQVMASYRNVPRPPTGLEVHEGGILPPEKRFLQSKKPFSHSVLTPDHPDNEPVNAHKGKDPPAEKKNHTTIQSAEPQG